MTITIFTSNQPRHLSLIRDLSKISKKVYAIIEVSTVFPGEVKDFYNNSPIMNKYFQKVRNCLQNSSLRSVWFSSITISATAKTSRTAGPCA